MDIAHLIDGIDVVELAATTRAEAVRALVESMNWPEQGVSTEHVIAAIEERESTAQTIIAEGLALPHAAIEWNGDARSVLGRSRSGVEFGVSGNRVHLIVLSVFGTKESRAHLEALAALAELFGAPEFRLALVEAPDAGTIRRLLRERSGLISQGRARLKSAASRPNVVLVQSAVQLTQTLKAQALLLAVDRLESVPWETLTSWSGRLLVVTSEKADNVTIERAESYYFSVPHAGLSRLDRANLGLLLAASNGLVDDQGDVVCVTGPRGTRLDSITVAKPAPHIRAMFSNPTASGMQPAVLIRIVSLAIEIAAEGREGRPIGALFIIGDSRRVLKQSQQLVLNPFHGFPHRLRNVLDPSLTETLKEFAMLDGAIVVQEDGTALSSGTYLIPKATVTELPAGLGARHQAAAAITAHTRSIAVTVSQSTGTVTLFRGGAIVLALERASLTRW